MGYVIKFELIDKLLCTFSLNKKNKLPEKKSYHYTKL